MGVILTPSSIFFRKISTSYLCNNFFWELESSKCKAAWESQVVPVFFIIFVVNFFQLLEILFELCWVVFDYYHPLGWWENYLVWDFTNYCSQNAFTSSIIILTVGPAYKDGQNSKTVKRDLYLQEFLLFFLWAIVDN